MRQHKCSLFSVADFHTRLLPNIQSPAAEFLRKSNPRQITTITLTVLSEGFIEKFPAHVSTAKGLLAFPGLREEEGVCTEVFKSLSTLNIVEGERMLPQTPDRNFSCSVPSMIAGAARDKIYH